MEPKKQQTSTNLQTVLKTNRGLISGSAHPIIKENLSAWLTRSMVELSSNTDLMAYIKSSENAQNDFIQKLAKCAQVGLQIGGTRPHAYFIVQGNRIRLDITKDGRIHVICHGTKPVLKYLPEIIAVHEAEKETFAIRPDKTVCHEYRPFGDRGNVIGWYAILEYLDGHREIPFITKDRVDHIKSKSSNLNSPAWKNFPMMMEENIAAKQLLKNAWSRSEGLALANIIADDENLPEITEPEKDISSRASDKLDTVLNHVDDKIIDVPVSSAPVSSVPVESAPDKKKAELF